MKDAVIVLNFGEPSKPALEEVIPFLERIFLTNANLEAHATPEERQKRSRELAERRAPGLIEAYERIGSSPMNAQANAQARALGMELHRRGRRIPVYSAFQFTPPLVADMVDKACRDGVTRLVGLPIYPLCGPSTTVAALNEVQRAIDGLAWDVEYLGISGWHGHPAYLELRADRIRRLADERGVSLDDPETRLVFSAHGTPKRYLDEGSRYEEYVKEFCADIARRLGVAHYELGYQNHANRNIRWTEPGIEVVVEQLRAKRIVVDAVSFMHEQSETLAELDLELKEKAEMTGLEFHRVPIPHDDPRFARMLADLVDGVLASETAGVLSLAPCRCRPALGTFCLNAPPDPQPRRAAARKALP
ncbi:MAG: ferrochelatase [Gemmatimonadetes bacterium]|nr:ferrochelatase [Gemmatimonadota bacterium]